jgi:hypothetical protein
MRYAAVLVVLASAFAACGGSSGGGLGSVTTNDLAIMVLPAAAAEGKITTEDILGFATTMAQKMEAEER